MMIAVQVDIPAQLNVDLIHCERVAAELVAASNGQLQLTAGELLSSKYFDAMAAEVQELLSETGAVSIGVVHESFAVLPYCIVPSFSLAVLITHPSVLFCTFACMACSTVGIQEVSRKHPFQSSPRGQPRHPRTLLQATWRANCPCPWSWSPVCSAAGREA
jgi:hypothetical protein